MIRRDGVILLELLISVGIFVGAAIAISGSMRDASAALAAAQDRSVAVDLARSALALIESGQATPESLQGEVKGGALDPDRVLDGWTLEVGVESAGGGLLRVEVSASIEPAGTLASLTEVVPGRGGAF